MRPCCSSRTKRVLLFAVLPVLAGADDVLAGLTVQRVIQPPAAETAAGGLAPPSPFASITAYPMHSPPIAGFIPRVAFGLTNQQAPNDLTFAARISSSPGGTALPSGGPVHYAIGTVDTGAQSHIVRAADAQIFNLSGANRAGSYLAEIAGASGSEFANISDGLGIYWTGLANASGGSSISVTPGTLRGQWNTSILTAEPTSSLPNIIGAPAFAQYQTVIRTSQPRSLTVGAQTYESPDVAFQAQNTPLPSNYYRLSLDVKSPAGISPDPVFIPSLDNFSNYADNPTTPTFWASMYANVISSGAGGTTPEREFLFDTGAQVTVLSQETAAEVGFYSAGENPSTPEFFVEVQGVGGTQMVPGFHLNTLRVMTNGGPLVWSNVPVLVLDLIDPRDAVGFVPGILGMNLFTDRDLIVNGGTTNPSVGISPQQQWAANASGVWSDSSNWVLGAVPNGAGRPANFLSRIAAPQTVTVDGDYTLGTITFDNPSRYTLNGTGRLTLAVEDGLVAGITAVTGSHTINAPLTFGSDTVVGVLQSGATLTLGGDVTATGVEVTKTGAGAADMKHVRAAGLNVAAGRLTILPNGTAAGTSNVATLAVASGGTLDLKNNDLVVREGDVGAWSGSGYTGITGLLAAGRNGGNWGGNGIVTSLADAQSGLTTLGVARASEVLGIAGAQTAIWSGQTVTGDAVLVAYTYGGDANLDGVINVDDYGQIDFNVGLGGAVLGYFNGDFNLDGQINVDDYGIIDFNVGIQGPPLVGSGLGDVSAVPEPALLAAPLLASLLLRRRRR